MATANDLMTYSMKLIGKLGQGETMTADDQTDCFNALNSMLESWWIQRLAVYQILKETFSLVANDVDYTIGSGGNFNTTRPVKIDSAQIRDNSMDYPMEQIYSDEYAAIMNKAVTSTIPYQFYYDNAYPLATIYLYPVPSSANQIILNTWKQLQSFSAVTTTVALPPGYERAIKYNLALEIAPLFGVDVTSGVRKIAAESLGDIKRANETPLYAQLDPAILGRRRYNIYTDE
tara:strand:- start:131 stop:826 length:696 start_codon:yes stop_codon:yes gene_type:complete